jgi:hypothetical protein
MSSRQQQGNPDDSDRGTTYRGNDRDWQGTQTQNRYVLASMSSAGNISFHKGPCPQTYQFRISGEPITMAANHEIPSAISLLKVYATATRATTSVALTISHLEARQHKQTGAQG